MSNEVRGILRRVAAGAVVLGLAYGCTAAGSAGSGATGASVGAASGSPALASSAPAAALPACASAGPAVSFPPDFPANFPLPDGTVVVGTDTPPGGGSRIKVLVPLEVDAYGEFLEKALPAAGMAIGGGEAEADELESKFSGTGFAGQLIAREVSGCPGVLSVLVAVRAS